MLLGLGDEGMFLLKTANPSWVNDLKIASLILPWILAIFGVYKWFIQPKRDAREKLRANVYDFRKLASDTTRKCDQMISNTQVTAVDLSNLRVDIENLYLKFLDIRKYLGDDLRMASNDLVKTLRANLHTLEIESKESKVKPNLHNLGSGAAGVVYTLNQSPNELEVVQEGTTELLEKKSEFKRAIRRGKKYSKVSVFKRIMNKFHSIKMRVKDWHSKHKRK